VVELDGAYLDVDEHGVVEELAQNALVGISRTKGRLMGRDE